MKEIKRNIANEEENLLCITEVAGMKDTSVKMEFTNEISGLEQELIMMGNLEIIKVSTDMPFPGVKSQLAKCLYDIQSGIDRIIFLIFNSLSIQTSTFVVVLY